MLRTKSRFRNSVALIIARSSLTMKLGTFYYRLNIDSHLDEQTLRQKQVFEQTEVNFINILQAAFAPIILGRKLFVLAVWLFKFLAQGY